MSTTIKKELAESNHWNVKDLFNTAIENSAEKDPAILTSMNDALFMGERTNLLEDEEKISEGMMILSNRSGMYGAAAIFFPGIIFCI